MKVLLINPFRYFGINKTLHRRYPIPAMTLPYLASLVPDGHEVKMVDEALTGIDFDEPADLVAITTMTVNAYRAYDIAKEFRKRGRIVVMGGPHASAVPEETKLHCDAVAVGNGEATMKKIIEDVENRSLKEYYHGDEPTVVPDDITGSIATSWQTAILASRGCELSCDFCSTQNIFGNFYLQRGASRVIDDINRAKTDYIFFIDDNFYGATKVSQAYYDQLMEAVAKSGRRWMAQVRLPILKKEKNLQKFKDNNCMGVFVGFESINPKNHSALNKQKVDKAMYAEAVDLIHEYGIGVFGSFIFGFDDDTPDTISETTEFCIDSKIEMAAFQVLTPYPGTATYEKFNREGRIFSRDWRSYDTDKVVYTPKNFLPHELEDQMLGALKEFYSFPSIFKRLRFGMNYDTTKLFLLPNIMRNRSLALIK